MIIHLEAFNPYQKLQYIIHILLLEKICYDTRKMLKIAMTETRMQLETGITYINRKCINCKMRAREKQISIMDN